MKNKKKLDDLMNEDWINQPALLDCKYGKVPGSVLYGVREPITPAICPLIPCPISSKERIYGEEPRYWFVRDDNTIKVRLYFLRGNKEELKAVGRDSGIFKVKIRKK